MENAKNQSAVLDRLELALARVETATTTIQQQRHRAEHQYRMLHHAGIETLAAIDVLMASDDDQKADAA